MPEQMWAGYELKRQIRRLESECNRLITNNDSALVTIKRPHMIDYDATD
jgi:hypothetical protein